MLGNVGNSGSAVGPEFDGIGFTKAKKTPLITFHPLITAHPLITVHPLITESTCNMGQFSQTSNDIQGLKYSHTLSVTVQD